MSLKFAIPLPDSSGKLDLEYGSFGSKKVYFEGRQIAGGSKAKTKFTSGGTEYKLVLRSHFVDVLPKVVINGEVIGYFEPLDNVMFAIGLLAKIATILGVINGVVGIIPGLFANVWGQYAYRQMDNRTSATIIAGVLMVGAWLTVVLGVALWVRLFNNIF